MNTEFIKILIRRILQSIILVFLIISFIFFLVRMAPGNPLQNYISPDLNPALAAKISESFNLNDSIFDQYIGFVTNLLSGDLGISFTYRTSVVEVLSQFLPFTILLAFLSIIIQILGSVILAVILLKYQLKRFSEMLLSLYTIPAFVLALFLIYLFSYKLQLFPISGLGLNGSSSVGFFSKITNSIPNLILPLITLSLGGIIYLYKYLLTELDSVYKSNFVLKMKAEGESTRTIVIRHIIPNAVGPLITLVGIEVGMLLSGAIITEMIFALPGMGRLTIHALQFRDYPLIIGTVFTSAIFVIGANLVADLIRASIDKRYAVRLIK